MAAAPETKLSLRTERTESCWLWRGPLDRSGYGKLRVCEAGVARTVSAHRLAWTLAHGPIPEGLLVCHHCDTPACVRPDHLFLGTHIDNMADMVRKGRARTSDKHGSNNPRSKLTPEQVRLIFAWRAMGESQGKIALKLGINQSTVSDIERGRRWANLRPQAGG